MSTFNLEKKFYNEVEIFLLDNYSEPFEFLNCNLFSNPIELISFPEKKLLVNAIAIDSLQQNSFPFNYCHQLSSHYNKIGVAIIHLWEDVWKNNIALASARLLAQIGKSKRIHGRLTKVIQLNKTEADIFLNQHHLQKSTTAYYKYGLIFKDELVAVATFSKGRNMTYEKAPYRSFELVRFASKAGTTVTGGLSKLLQHFIKEINPDHLMTYADRDWSDGKTYEKLGFKLVEITPPQEFFIDIINYTRYYPDKILTKFSEEFELQNDLTWNKFLEQHYLLKIANAGNKKYILDLRNKKSAQ